VNAELRFNSTDIDSSIKKSEIVFSPTVTGKEYNVDEMGDGLRSLFYISMVDSILAVENKIREELKDNPDNVSFNKQPPILTIIAVEEPENHIL
jgi:putative ATP-dependent endonuclease of OLD family